jgi:hypothetical protein
MSTRAVIAHATGPDSFVGVYHHWDGYPSGLGKTLWDLYHGHFKRDLNAMLDILTKQHTAWSTINVDNWDAPIGYGGNGPACYCHGERSEHTTPLTQHDAQDSGCEYAYVFTETGFHILSSYTPDGDKMIGAFGSGHPDATWHDIAFVDFAEPEPAWDSLG